MTQSEREQIIESYLNDMLEHYSREDESFSEYPDIEQTVSKLNNLFNTELALKETTDER